MRSSAATRSLLLLGLLFILVAGVCPGARADSPSQVTNPDASRTISWTMNSPAGLVADNVTVNGGQAALSWRPATLAWNRSQDILSNGTGTPNVVKGTSGLRLWANRSNYVADPNFLTAAPWRYLNATGRNVTASWNGSAANANLASRSPGTEFLWDSMDASTPALNWTATPGQLVAQNGSSNPMPKQGTGTMGLWVANSLKSVGAIRQSIGALDWSTYDRLVLWIYLNASLSVSFNLTGHHGTSSRVLTTTAQSVVKGWNEVAVDLVQLGNASTRSNLTYLTLWFTSATPIPKGTWFDLDDLRLGTAKVFSGTASVSQLVYKANATTPLQGSGVLSFDWCFVRAVGASLAEISVAVGPSSAPGPVVALPRSPDGAWRSTSLDVSAATTGAGWYNVSLGLSVAVNTTSVTDVRLVLDNVTLVFPEAANGTFASRAMTMGSGSEYLGLGWSGLVPASTSIRVGVRVGNTTVPGTGTWSGWQTSSVSGARVALSLPPAIRFQIRIDLNTTNASVSPSLASLNLETRHRAAAGNLSSTFISGDADFLRWRSFNASTAAGAASSVAFFLWNGTWDTPVSSNANLSTYAGGRTIQWRALFTSPDGVQSPSLTLVRLVYEYQGPVTQVRISPHGASAAVGQWVHLRADAFDAGWHRVANLSSPFSWTGGDPTGHLYSNGSYLPNEAGRWNVTATLTVAGLVYSDTVVITVTAPGTGGPTGWAAALPFLPYLVAVLAAAGVGFVIYEFAVRRMFSVDDVFVISRDGRLMMHNTRRMRADRDEDVLSGMLTAIIAFLKDWDPEENGKAKRFDYGDKTALLEHGERVFVAAVYSGRIPRWASKDLARFVRDLEVQFGDTFHQWSGDPADLHGLREFVGRFVTHTRYHRNGRVNGRADGKAG